jgi:hypothetical protein
MTMYLVGSGRFTHKQEHVCGRGEGPREDDVPGGSAKLKHKQKHVYGQGEGPMEDSVSCGVC